LYKRITEHFGPQWDVLLQVADLYNKSGHFEEAADALKQMSAIDPGNKELKHTLAQTYVRANRLSDALATEKELMEDEPANLGYRIEVGGILLAQKEYDRAALLFDPILNSDSVAADAQTRVAELYFGQLGKDSTLLPLAQSVIERVRDAHPADWRPYWFLGGVGSMKKDDSLAARNFRKVTELAGWNADGWVFLSSIYVSKNRFAEALPILEAAIKVVPDDFRVNFLLGVAYNRSGRNQEAALTLEKARQINPRDIDAIGQLALVYEQLKQQDEADSLYEEALRLDPHNYLILNNYSYSLAERDVQLERALEMAKTAVDAEPGLASYLDTIGWVYYRLGRYEQAENYVKKAVTSGEASAVVFEHLGDIYYKLNKPSEALEQWNAALKLDQNNAVLREKINRGSL
jgi:tetratricopeptide (TPR) repeat protein